jgi:hypothetical protein
MRLRLAIQAASAPTTATSQITLTRARYTAADGLIA